MHILQHFQSSKEFQVARYNRIKHAAPSTICLWYVPEYFLIFDFLVETVSFRFTQCQG